MADASVAPLTALTSDHRALIIHKITEIIDNPQLLAAILVSHEGRKATNSDLRTTALETMSVSKVLDMATHPSPSPEMPGLHQLSPKAVSLGGNGAPTLNKAFPTLLEANPTTPASEPPHSSAPGNVPVLNSTFSPTIYDSMPGLVSKSGSGSGSRNIPIGALSSSIVSDSALHLMNLANTGSEPSKLGMPAALFGPASGSMGILQSGSVFIPSDVGVGSESRDLNVDAFDSKGAGYGTDTGVNTSDFVASGSHMGAGLRSFADPRPN